MNTLSPSFISRLAVCSWSLQPNSPEELVQQLQAIGVRRTQLALDPVRTEPVVWGRVAEVFAAAGVSIASGMFGTVGEDYSSLETIRRTGGVVPDATWEENWRNIQATADLAVRLGLKLVTFHAGFLPHEEADPNFVKLLDRITRVANVFAARGIELGFETGQETADTLKAFLLKLNRPEVGVNFDPANMLLYDKGDPIVALRTLGPWLKQCHIKDANRTKIPGTWGEEVAAGTGQVDWPAFFRVLGELGFEGNLSIEREAGTQRVQDIQAARELVVRLTAAEAPASSGVNPQPPTPFPAVVNVGVVGLGFMGVTHIKSYQKIPGAHIVAVCDAFRLPKDGVLTGVSGNVADGDAVRLDMAKVKAYSKLEDLLADPSIQLVDLCVPTPDHPAMVLAALQAGKHVICEKPLARTAHLSRQIVEAVRVARTYFMPAMCMRFWPGWAWLKQTIDAGTYGKVLAARFRRVSGPPGWSRANYFKGSDSGGALLDLHIHDVDFVQFCFGRPRAVASLGQQRFSGAIDHVVTQYHVPGGASVYAEGSWLMSEGFGFSMTYTVNFERATADFDGGRGADALRLFEDGQSPRTVPCEGGDGYIGELTHMLDCIRNGTPPTVVTAADGLSAVEICEAEEQSVQTGQVIAL